MQNMGKQIAVKILLPTICLPTPLLVVEMLRDGGLQEIELGTQATVAKLTLKSFVVGAMKKIVQNQKHARMRRGRVHIWMRFPISWCCEGVLVGGRLVSHSLWSGGVLLVVVVVVVVGGGGMEEST
jgi:hypothetical protein